MAAVEINLFFVLTYLIENLVFLPGENQMKALILCAGKGTRLSPLTDSIAKPLIPVANRPILFYVLDKIKEVGISEIGIVVSPDNRYQIQKTVGSCSDWNFHIEYIVQSEAKGLAHAVLSAENFLKKSSFLLFLGDNLIGENLNSFVTNFQKRKCSAYILLKEVCNPRFFGVAELDNTGKVICLEEKPAEPRSNLALIGVYLFGSISHKAAGSIQPSRRGELEITDAIQWLLDNGKAVYSQIVTGWWFDTGKKEDLLEANRFILDETCKLDIKAIVDAQSLLIGNVKIEEKCSIVNSRITGPAIIGSGCKIINSTIGPYVSLGSGTVIEESQLKNNIVLQDCQILRVENLIDSIIGPGTTISSGKEKRVTSGLLTGSGTNIQV